MAFVRLPVERNGLHLIPLWHERPVIVVPRDHVVSVFEEVALADLDEEHVWNLSQVTAAQAVEAVAAGTGVVVLPAALARALHRKDVVAVPVTDVPHTQIGLAWRQENDDPDIETFIGIVRGRTERSTRGR
jgi:DNA-binding transcriptional LysR family regulator